MAAVEKGSTYLLQSSIDSFPLHSGFFTFSFFSCSVAISKANPPALMESISNKAEAQGDATSFHLQVKSSPLTPPTLLRIRALIIRILIAGDSCAGVPVSLYSSGFRREPHFVVRKSLFPSFGGHWPTRI